MLSTFDLHGYLISSESVNPYGSQFFKVLKNPVLFENFENVYY